MRILVTGGVGFIGSHLVDRLVMDGHTVTVIDQHDAAEEKKNVRAIYHRLNILDRTVMDVFLQQKPEIVFHLAAYIDDRASVREPDVCTENNVMGTLNILEAAKASGVRRIVFTSTSVYYGEQETLPIPEVATPRPLTPYAVSKLIGEQYLRYYREHYHISSLALRCANVYGPRQDESRECGAIAIFTDRLLHDEPVFVNNDGLTTRDYIYVDDVVECLVRAGESSYDGVVNCSTGKGTTTQTLFDFVQKAVGKGQAGQRPEIMDHPKHAVLSPDRARKELGFEAKMPLVEGIAKTVEWYKMRGT